MNSELPTREAACRIIREHLKGEPLNEIDYIIRCRQETIETEIADWGSSESEPMDEVDALIDRLELAEDRSNDRDNYTYKELKAIRKERDAYLEMMLRLGLLKPFEPGGVEWRSSTGRFSESKPTWKLNGNGYDLRFDTWTETYKALQ